VGEAANEAEGDAIRAGKQTLPLLGMTKFWRNCMGVEKLEAVFGQQVITTDDTRIHALRKT
jgi:hypothetical protein